MKRILTTLTLLLIISVNAFGGVEYDKCMKEEKSLKTQETRDCSGLSYLLNPNACFVTQKNMKEYESGKCKRIGIAENVDFSIPKIIPEKKFTRANNSNNTTVETQVPQHKNIIDQLKEENSILKAEIIRLKAENEQLKKRLVCQ